LLALFAAFYIGYVIYKSCQKECEH
jgi:hypothetical protein